MASARQRTALVTSRSELHGRNYLQARHSGQTPATACDEELPLLVKSAEGKDMNAAPDLQAELESSYTQVREDFAPLAFLYDLRIHGALAHPPSKEEATEAATQLGLPEQRWHRTDYLRLLKLITGSVDRISGYLESATDCLA